MVKKILIGLLVVGAIFGGKYVYDMHINHNFETITEGKVYKSGVIPPDELEAYIKKVQIESRVMGDLALNHIIPTAILYQNKLIENANGLAGLGLDNTAAIETIKEISKHLESINKNVHGMTEARKQLNKEEDIVKRAKGYCNDVKEAYFDKIRYAVDKLELVVDDELWPLVKYREMLFIK